jgi:hypothetical protein
LIAGANAMMPNADIDADCATLFAARGINATVQIAQSDAKLDSGGG